MVTVASRHRRSRGLDVAGPDHFGSAVGGGVVPPLLRSRSQRTADSIVDFNYTLDLLGRTNGNLEVSPPGDPTDVPTIPRTAVRLGARCPRPPGSARRRCPRRCPGRARPRSHRSAKRRRDVLRVLRLRDPRDAPGGSGHALGGGVGAADLRRRALGRVPRVVGMGTQRAGRTDRQGPLHAGAAGARARACDAAHRRSRRGGPSGGDRRDRRARPSDIRGEAPRPRGDDRRVASRDPGVRRVDPGDAPRGVRTRRSCWRARRAITSRLPMPRSSAIPTCAAADRCTTPRRSWPRRGARSRWCATIRCPRRRRSVSTRRRICNGLAEAASELRRQLLDRLRAGELAARRGADERDGRDLLAARDDRLSRRRHRWSAAHDRRVARGARTHSRRSHDRDGRGPAAGRDRTRIAELVSYRIADREIDARAGVGQQRVDQRSADAGRAK